MIKKPVKNKNVALSVEVQKELKKRAVDQDMTMLEYLEKMLIQKWEKEDKTDGNTKGNKQ